MAPIKSGIGLGFSLLSYLLQFLVRLRKLLAKLLALIRYEPRLGFDIAASYIDSGRRRQHTNERLKIGG